jgi:spore maturation protein CgeB
MTMTFKRATRGLFRRLLKLHLYPKIIVMNGLWRRFFPVPPVEVLLDEWLEVLNPGADRSVLYLGLKFDYGDRSRGLAYEEHNFFRCLKNMRNYRIYRIDVFSIASRYGKKTANLVLNEFLLQTRVHKAFFLHYKDIYEIALIRRMKEEFGIETILWLFDDDKRFEETKAFIPNFSKSVTSLPERHEYRKSKGLNSVLAQFSVNHFLYRDWGFERNIDVLFVGQKFGNRARYIEKLRKNGIDVLAYGLGWETSRLSQGQMIGCLQRAKIALNFSSSEGNSHLKFIKGRIFEIPATGAMLLTEETQHLDEFFEIGAELDVFRTEDELLEKVVFYLKYDTIRNEIAQKGKNKVLKSFTMETTLSQLFR